MFFTSIGMYHVAKIWVVIVKIGQFVPYTTFWKNDLGSRHIGSVGIIYLQQFNIPKE